MGPIPVVVQDLPREAEEGLDFEAVAFLRFSEVLGPRCVDLGSDSTATASEQIARTVEAMNRGVDVILGGWLPDDLRGGRRGRPDLLIRGAARSDGGPGYHAGEIKRHRLTQKASATKSLRYSTPERPLEGDAITLPGTVLMKRVEDWLQVAHYYRMLESAGFAAPGPPMAALVGTDVLDGHEFPLTWLDLGAPRLETYSRSSDTGKALRSVVEHYDHQFGFRQDIAQRAIQRGKDPSLPPLVLPILQEECQYCPWREVCPLLLADDDANRSLPAGGPEQQREWALLRAAGVTTLAQLAALDLQGPEVAGVLAQVHGASHVQKRIASLRRKAGLVQRGVLIERTTTDPIDLPVHDVEIDFDIEWRTDHRIYLYGFLLTDSASASVYHHLSSFQPLTDDSARSLAEKAVEWLSEQRSTAESAGRTFRIYHYASPEISQVRGALQVEHPLFEDLVRCNFTDLVGIVRENFSGVWGLGLKQVAPEAGFHWRDDDPGGRNSMVWADEAVEGNIVSQRRVLDYNEDDVRATLAVRRWIREQI